MVGQFFASIARYFNANRWMFWIAFISIIIFLGFGITRLRVERDIYSIFPKGKEFQEFSQVIQENNLNKQLVFSFAAEDEDLNFEHIDYLVEQLGKQFYKEIGNLQPYRDVNQQQLISYLQTASIAYLSKGEYASLNNKLDTVNVGKQLSLVKEKLTGSNALFLGQYFSKDPLNLLGQKLQSFNIQSDSSAYTVENGIVYSYDKQKVFVFADLLLDSKDNAGLKQLDEKLTQFRYSQKSIRELDYFGVYQIGLANAEQIKKDTTLTTIISVSLILLVLILYYRSIFTPFVFLLPAFFGVLCGLGLTGYFKPEINGISIATASVLLGIVLDYSFHFFTHYKHSGSLFKTIEEIGSPMIIGSFTTVAAFAALLFTDSIVLQNFGTIALFTLLGAAIFTLVALPVLLQTIGYKVKIAENKNQFSFKIPKVLTRVMLLLIVGFTAFSWMRSEGMNFDDDLNNLAFHPDALKEKESKFTGIEPSDEKRLYIFSNGATIDEAKVVAEDLYTFIQASKSKFQLEEIISAAPYLLSNQRMKDATLQWNSLWKNHRSVVDQLLQEQAKLGFADDAFQPFIQSIDRPFLASENGLMLIDQMGMNRLVNSSVDKTSILTSVVLPKSQVGAFKSAIENIDGIYIMDIAEVASDMLVSVKNDFNFLLYFSSGIVFLSLLVVYGRIELAIFAFSPMLLSWIWIIGVTSMLNIPFNFVNIILTTFIFGLGDDYSIFVTDGLLQKYKTKKDNISSYKSAIILSALTTIIGTGALLFAKHPSIHSIALISVIGITSILVITLVVQPHVFHWFVTRRTNKRKGPLTFFTGIYSCLLFTYFFLGSMFLSLFLIFIVLPFPVAKVKKQQWMNFLISKLAKSTLYAGFHVHKKIIDANKLDYSKPSIIVCNHSSFLDILAVLMMHPKTIIMVKSWVYNSPVFGLFIRYAGYIFVENGSEENIQLVKNQMENGYSLVIFPEGTRSASGEIGRFHKGAFYLAKKLNVPIQPLLLIGFHEVNAKNDLMINNGTVIIKALDRVSSDATETDKEFTKRVQNLMRSEFKKSKLEHGDSNFWTHYIMRNYVFKGPVLEWYVRIKFKLERKNFEKYDHIIGERTRVYDVGAGYGYLSYYLHYRNPQRQIVGMDYDEEKILTADNGIKINENLNFLAADLRAFQPEAADVIIINDVLHYLSPVDQLAVLDRMYQSLNDQGTLIIRDGVVDLDGRIKNTERTEQLSTKLFKFNKVDTELTFLRISWVKEFAQNRGLTFSMEEHSSTTSNVLFILNKV